MNPFFSKVFLQTQSLKQNIINSQKPLYSKDICSIIHNIEETAINKLTHEIQTKYGYSPNELQPIFSNISEMILDGKTITSLENKQ
jgi:hypothetical protein